MLRKITQGAGNINLERTLASTTSQSFNSISLKTFSTWLDAHHISQFTTGQVSTRPLASTSRTKNGRRFASTRNFPRQNASKTAEDTAQLPRFIRRQLLQQNGTTSEANLNAMKTDPAKRSNKSSLVTKDTQNSAFRSRHYDPSQETTPKSELRMLEPHVLSERLKKLSDAGKIDDAVFMLKNAPLDAQNTPVWNTLIWETLKAKRYQLSYQLYVDMKRRGFAPSTRTYQTIFTGLSRIEHWPTHPKQLENARSLYQSFQHHLESIKRYDANDPELSVDPIAGYIRILGGAGHYQDIFDVFYALDHDGPLAPNQYIFTAMFQAINTALGDTTEGRVKVAGDARLLWGQLVKAAKKNPKITVDSHTAVSAVKALAGGNKPDHELAFKILAQYFGLETNKAVSTAGLFPLGPEALASALRLCNQTENYAICRQFFQQVKRRPAENGGASILDRAHMEEILKAEIALKEPGLGYHAVETLEWMLREEITGVNGPKIRPALSTYNLVMQACWYSADWSSATRTFDLMTGYHAHDFMDGSIASVPRLDKRGPGRSHEASAEFVSIMLKAALATKNRADMRQTLRIVDYLGFEKVLSSGPAERHDTSRSNKHKSFYGGKLASAIIETVDAVLVENGKYAKPEEAKKWRALAKDAKAQLEKPQSLNASTPTKPFSKSIGRRT